MNGEEELLPLTIVLEYRQFEVFDTVTANGTVTIKDIIPEDPQDSIVFWYENESFSISGSFRDVFLAKTIRYKTYQFTQGNDYKAEQSHITNKFDQVPTRPIDAPDTVEIYHYTPDGRSERDFTFTIIYDVLVWEDEMPEPVLYENQETTRFITVQQDYSTGRDALLHKLNTGLEPPDIDPVLPGSELV